MPSKDEDRSPSDAELRSPTRSTGRAPALSSPPGETAGQPAKCGLIVDDDKLIRSLLAEELGQSFPLLEASDQLPGLRSIDEHREALAFLVVDHQLPGGSGIELLERSLSRCPNAVRVLITASPTPALAEEAVNRARVDRFYVKPIDVELLRRELLTLVNQRQQEARVTACLQESRTIQQLASSSVLILEDDEGAMEVFEAVLAIDGHELLRARSGAEALDILGSRSVDLLVLDKNLPDGSGLRVLEVAKQLHPDLLGIVVTAYASAESAIEAMEAGAYDYLRKPLKDIELLRRVVARALDHQRIARDRQRLLINLVEVNDELRQLNASLLSSQTRLRGHLDELELMQDATVMSLTRLAEYRDRETGAHLERMRSYARIIAMGLLERGDYPEVDAGYVDAIYRTAPLHDIGKVGIPDNILRKPESLSPEEWEIMRTHPRIGGDTLEEAEKNAGQEGRGGLLQLGKEIAYYHHERWDGSGYPFGLAGEEIPLCARIIAIADSYDAICSQRVYKASTSHQEACAILKRLAGIKFDAVLIEVFLERSDQILAIQERYKDLVPQGSDPSLSFAVSPG